MPGDGCCNLGTKTASHPRFVSNHQSMRAAHRLEDAFSVPWRKGAEIEKMTEEISKLSGGKQVKIDIIEIKSPDLDAQLVAENIAMQMERRISFRRAMKKSLQTTMEQGAKGIKVRCAGRLGGAEISRAEWYREGSIPLHTLRTPIDYGFAEARTTYGIIGVKCWICKPAILAQEEKKAASAAEKPEGAEQQSAA